MSRPTIPSKRSAPADAQEAAWVADEDRFVLEQAKKKAAIRVKGGRAQPIDWLAATLAVIDPDKNPLDDELEDGDIDQLDPESVFEDLDDEQLLELEKGIDTYMTLERSKSNVEYWNMMSTISKDRRRKFQTQKSTARGVDSVSSDLDKLLSPKSLEELEKLEKQIRAKLSSGEPIDTDYWEHLLKSLLTYKAKAKLRELSHSIVEARLDTLRTQQAAQASAMALRLQATFGDEEAFHGEEARDSEERHELDPEPLLRLRQEDKTLESLTYDEFARQTTEQRQKVIRLGFVPSHLRSSHGGTTEEPAAKRMRTDGEAGVAQANASLFDREVARGLGENEEIFSAEEEVITKNKTDWAHKYRPRKPKYFNRVLSGYEWNKYNQTHYDHENLPPKVVQGYKFNVFYPDLVDKTRAPTFRIERENGRKRGQTFAPAGENDTCLIRFMAGPPYEDIAFRVVDREWDYSAKRERGFRSSFDKVSFKEP